MSSIAENMAGEREAAQHLLAEAAEVASGVEDVPTQVTVLQARSLGGVFEGDPDAVRRAATEGLRLSQEVGDLYAQHMMLLNLGSAAFFAGDMAESKQRYEAALRIAFDVDDRIGEYYMLAALAFHAGLDGRPRIAAQLLGASDTIRLGAGATVMSTLAPFIMQTEEAATRALGPAKYRSELDAGRGLSREAAVRLALGQQPARAEAPAPVEGLDGALGARQLEVARLVAAGLTNKQIASRLFLSERTVDSHVRTILNKLGFNTRAQIAGWVATLD
jgi:DNA-binding CsgD family transcriptional regulator